MTPTQSHPKDGEPLKVLFVGDSHIEQIVDAYAEWVRARCPESRQFKADFVSFVEPEFALNRTAAADSDVLNARATEAITKSAADAIVSCVGGNAHNRVGLVNHPQRFDFVLAEDPDLPLDPSATILPSDAVRASLERAMSPRMRAFHAVCARTTKPMFHIESPPPIPSEDHIRRHPGVFGSKIAELGVSPALLRYKLWRLHSTIVRELCVEAGVTFVPAPGEARDAHGMMVERAWGDDPTHGNRWYGELVLRQLAAIIGASPPA